MAIVDGSLQLGYKNTAWFTANASLVLLVGQIVYLEQTGTYKIGDGVTTLGALSFLGVSQDLQSVLANDNKTGGSNIVISLGDLIKDILGVNYIDIQQAGTVEFGTTNGYFFIDASKFEIFHSVKLKLDAPLIEATQLTPSQIVETDASKNLVSAAKGTAYNKNFGTGTANIVEIGSTLSNSQITSTDANGKLQTLTTATYPSLTELSYGKGVTSAIQTQLNAKLSATTGAFIKSLIKQNTTISHTGTTSETKLYSVLIPSGTMNANDILEYYAWIIPGIGSGNRTVKVYLNTSNAIGGIQIATYTFLTTSTILKRKITFKNSLSTQEIIPGGTTNLGNGEASTYNSSNVSSIAANFNNDVWFVISMTLATGTDNVSIYSIGSNILR